MKTNHASYAAALRQTLRTTAAAYGYALSTTTTAAILTSVRGKPHPAELFLFIAGALTGFAALEIGLLATGSDGQNSEDGGQAFPFAGVLNCFSVPAALGASIGLAHLLHGIIAWLVAPLAATAIYLAVVGIQVEVVRATRG